MHIAHEVITVTHPHRPRTISAQQRLAAQAAAALAKPSGKSVREARQRVAALAWDARLAGDWATYRVVMRHLKELRSRTKAGKWKPTDAGAASASAFKSTSPAQRRRALDQLEPDSSAMLAISGVQERWTEPTPADAPKPRPPLGRTHTRVVHDTLTGQSRRARERRAREYAEAWYRALRDWKVYVTHEEQLPRRETGGTGEGRMRPIVGNWASRPLVVQAREVVTPWRNVAEGRIAPLVNVDPVLSRIRDGWTLATLVDPRGGWHPNRGTALTYAQAVLTLAYHLGDPRAHEHLRNLPPSP